jgi:alkanesulfonate monooxygenase SsuD/methylene tetrahydromethanopterin reductase-like flavin-dependent oxidoreductase (luciferase family)
VALGVTFGPGVTHGLLLWTTRTRWADLLRAALEGEQAGFDALYVSDHLLADTGDPDDPILDGPALVAALAAVTTRMRLGTMVSPVSLRHPALVAKHAVTVDQVSGGRQILGLGAGWLEREHVRHAIPFGSIGERMDRLEAAVRIIRRLTAGEPVHETSGPFPMSVRHGPAAAAPIPILIGGTGVRRTLPIVARYGDVWHANAPLEELTGLGPVVDSLAEEAGREPREITWSTNRWVCVTDDASEGMRRIQESLDFQKAGPAPAWKLAIGDAPAVAHSFEPFVRAGFRHLVWSFRAPFDLESIARLPEVRAAMEAIPTAEAPASY